VTLSIRTLTADELDTADAVLMAAYSSPSRKRELARYLALQPDGWRLATADGVPAGAGGAIDYGAFGYIGLVGVHPNMQRRGVALSLMHDLVAWLGERGTQVALLDASPAGYPLYERMGFIVDDTVTFFARETFLSSAVLGEVAESVRPARREDLPALAAFDTPRFGADRSSVLATYLDECSGRAFLSTDEAGRIAGFLFAPGLLGPWIAATPKAAEALLVAALSLPFDDLRGVQVPAANPHAEQLLRRFGFAPTRRLRHMRLGGRPQLARRTQLYGQASFALG